MWCTLVLAAAVATSWDFTRWPYLEVLPLHAAIFLAVPWLATMPAKARMSLSRALCGLAIVSIGMVGGVNGRPSAVKAKASALGFERSGWLVRNPVGMGPGEHCLEDIHEESPVQLANGLRSRRRAWGARAVRLAEHLGLPLSDDDRQAGLPILYGCLSFGEIQDIRRWMEDERRYQRCAEQLRTRVLAAVAR